MTIWERQLAETGLELPALPRLDDKLGQVLRGPTEWSNWLIPGLLMCGSYPGAFEDRKNEQRLKQILSKGIDTFVCLQEELDNHLPEEVWRNGVGLRPYYQDAQRIRRRELFWVQLPIPDGGIAPDEVTAELVVLLAEYLMTGRVLYLHCFGGHGRAGTFACLLLAYLYRLQASEAMKRVQAYHDCRIDPQGAKSPQTVAQRDQVKRLVQDLLAHPGPPLRIRQEHAAFDMDAAKRGAMKPAPMLKKIASCPALRDGAAGDDTESTPTSVSGRQRQLPLKLDVHPNAMPDFMLALQALPPGASAKRRRDAALRQKSAAAVQRRRPFGKQPCSIADGLAEILSGYR